jgi:hypothetical protein
MFRQTLPTYPRIKKKKNVVNIPPKKGTKTLIRKPPCGEKYFLKKYKQ